MNNSRRFLGLMTSTLLLAESALARTEAPASPAISASHAQTGPSVRIMKIRIRIDGHSGTATLLANNTATDFLKLLPLTLRLSDYTATEKISALPGKLSTSDAPAGVDPAVGDITYFAPWGNLGLFHRDFGFSKGLVKIGKLDSPMPILAKPGVPTATFEIADK